MNRILFAALLFAAHVGFSQYEEIITSNRPSTAISAWTVGAKTFQLEDGINYKTSSWPDAKVQNLSNELFARIGLAERVEANVTFGSGNETTWYSGVKSPSGFRLWTLDVGARVKILKGNRFKPDILLQGSFRTWSKTPYGYNPGGKVLLATNNTFDFLYFSTTFGAIFPSISNDVEFIYAICPEFYVRKNVSVYGEIFGSFNDFDHPGFDVGVAISPINDLQIDVFGGYITGGVVKTGFAEIGVSYRMDWRDESK